MDKSAVREYVEQAQSVIEASPQMDEANTKAAVLRDFLDLLGWEIPTNTQLEYSVKAFGKTYKVDYALVLEGVPVAFVEAKGVDTSLTENHREQLRAYLKNEDVNLGILTNGEEYEFFRRRVIDSKVEVNTLGETNLEELPERVTILRAFTKDAIQNDEWKKILDRINELKNARDTLENEKDDLAEDIVELLTENVSEVISSHAESQSKELIDRLVENIEDEIEVDSNGPSPPPVDGYIVNILEDGATIQSFSDSQQREVMAEVVDYLVAEHGLISEIEPLPYIPGRKKVIINDQRSYPDEEREMRAPKELTNGYYLETHDNKKGKKREIRRLAKRCGLEVDFDGGW